MDDVWNVIVAEALKRVSRLRMVPFLVPNFGS
jgi:hypothetical protein